MSRTTVLSRTALLAVLALCLVLLVSGCSTSGLNAPAQSSAESTQPTRTAPASSVATLTQSDSGRKVEVPVGGRLVVQLPSNRTTGYSWQATQTAGIVQAGEPVYDSPNTPGLVGAGGTETFTFTASSRGTSTLKLEYRRPWETGVPAEKTWSVTVTVE